DEPAAALETSAPDETSFPGAEVVRPISANAALATVRVLLKETKTGALAGKVDRLADDLGKPPEEFVAILVDAGLRIPEKPREKPVFIEHAGEILWLNKNAKGELWLNAKSSKFSGRETEVDELEESG